LSVRRCNCSIISLQGGNANAASAYVALMAGQADGALGAREFDDAITLEDLETRDPSPKKKHHKKAKKAKPAVAARDLEDVEDLKDDEELETRDPSPKKKHHKKAKKAKTGAVV
jgi:hypothetical protein